MRGMVDAHCTISPTCTALQAFLRCFIRRSWRYLSRIAICNIHCAIIVPQPRLSPSMIWNSQQQCLRLWQSALQYARIATAKAPFSLSFNCCWIMSQRRRTSTKAQPDHLQHKHCSNETTFPSNRYSAGPIEPKPWRPWRPSLIC